MKRNLIALQKLVDEPFLQPLYIYQESLLAYIVYVHITKRERRFIYARTNRTRSVNFENIHMFAVYQRNLDVYT